MNLSGRTVLLTGATGGLGQAIARALAARGAHLVLTARRVDVLEPLAAETGGRALACDLADPEAVAGLLREAGEIDALVANAGLPASGPLSDFSVDQIDRALAVNLRAPIVLARELAPALMARGTGHLVFVSSLAGKVATTGSALYSATKFGLRGFAFGMRQDLAPHGVGVSVVTPGFIRDAGMFADSGASLPPGVGTRSPEDVARAVVAAIEQDRAEIVVAPAALRIATTFGVAAPSVAAAVSRRAGSEKVAADLADGQRDQR